MNDIIRELKGDDIYENIIDKFSNDNYPEIEIPNELHDIFNLDYIDESYREKNFDYYQFDSIGVPRVSRILDKTINKDYLMIWASKLGWEKYNIEKSKALTIGSRAHEMIEEYLRTGKYPNNILFKTPKHLRRSVSCAYKNFVRWMEDLVKRNIYLSDVICMEKEIVCPYFGGTVDCIARINGRVFLIDFKTSKKISMEYLMQVCAYTWIINSGYIEGLPHIDGVGIIRVDKEDINKYDDLFLSFSETNQAKMINDYIRFFGVLTQSYYNIIQAEREFLVVKKEAKQNRIKTLGGLHD